MLQDWNTTIDEFGIRMLSCLDENKERYIEKLYEIVKKYDSEIIDELKQKNSACAHSGNLSKGHLLCLLGEHDKAKSCFDDAIKAYEKNPEGFAFPITNTLDFIINVCDEFILHGDKVVSHKSVESFLKRFATESKKQQTKVNKKKIKREIKYVEADLECELGDLDKHFSWARTKQAGLYEKLGDYEKAIEYYRESNKYSTWKDREYINNSVSILDCYSKLGDGQASCEALIEALNYFVPADTKPGDKLHDEFLNRYKDFMPYLEKLGIGISKVAELAQARLDKLETIPSLGGIHWEISEISGFLTVYLNSIGDHKKALEIWEQAIELNKKVEFPRNYSDIDYSELLIKASKQEKAMNVLEKQVKRHINIDDNDDKPKITELYDIANCYLQMGKVDEALDVIDLFCDIYISKEEREKDYEPVLNERRNQIDILERVIGPSYVELIRNYIKDKEPFKIKE